MQKYLFFDIDGVLNRKSQWKRPFSLANDCLDAFADLVHQSEYLPIMCSTWRRGLEMPDNVIQEAIIHPENTPGVNDLINRLAERNVKIYGKTPDLIGRSRDKEIDRFIYFNPTDNYFILDDDLTLYFNIDNIYRINCELGLTKTVTNRILRRI